MVVLKMGFMHKYCAHCIHRVNSIMVVYIGIFEIYNVVEMFTFNYLEKSLPMSYSSFICRKTFALKYNQTIYD
jgi:hypothetical protein